jgi:hypothetical protein
MKKTGWIVAVAMIAGGTLYASRSCKGVVTKAPDQQLADHFEAICEIASKNVTKPVRGVRQLGAYFADHTGDMLKDFGDTITTVERIKDDEKHDDRAYKARERIWAPLVDCAEDMQKFFDAIDNDEEATAILQRTMERVDRTIGIIFSGKHVDLRHLPRSLAELSGSGTSR